MIVAGVLDTSVFIANETGRALDESAIPEQVATTVITLAELNAGILAAGSADVRARRLATLRPHPCGVLIDRNRDSGLSLAA